MQLSVIVGLVACGNESEIEKVNAREAEQQSVSSALLAIREGEKRRGELNKEEVQGVVKEHLGANLGDQGYTLTDCEFRVNEKGPVEGLFGMIIYVGQFE